MSTFLQQLPTLIGVVIGALASYLVSASTEHSRWRREQSSRWDDRRAQAYAEYSNAVKSVYAQVLSIVDARRSGFVTDDAAIAELDKRVHERTVRWETVLLLGNTETITAGRAWHRRLGHAELFARGERSDPAEYEAVLDQVNADRARFYEAARNDLGIKTGKIPQGGLWEAPPPALVQPADES